MPSDARIAAAERYLKYFESLSPGLQRDISGSTSKRRTHHSHLKVLSHKKKTPTPTPKPTPKPTPTPTPTPKLTPTPVTTPTPKLTPTPVPKSVLVRPPKKAPRKNKFDEYLESIKNKPRIVLPKEKKKKKPKRKMYPEYWLSRE